MHELNRSDFDDAAFIAYVFADWIEKTPDLAAVLKKVSSSPKINTALNGSQDSTSRAEILVAAIIDEDPSSINKLVRGFLDSVKVHTHWSRVYEAADAPILARIADLADQENHKRNWKPYT